MILSNLQNCVCCFTQFIVFIIRRMMPPAGRSPVIYTESGCLLVYPVTLSRHIADCRYTQILTLDIYNTCNQIHWSECLKTSHRRHFIMSSRHSRQTLFLTCVYCLNCRSPLPSASQCCPYCALSIMHFQSADVTSRSSSRVTCHVSQDAICLDSVMKETFKDRSQFLFEE